MYSHFSKSIVKSQSDTKVGDGGNCSKEVSTVYTVNPSWLNAHSLHTTPTRAGYTLEGKGVSHYLRPYVRFHPRLRMKDHCKLNDLLGKASTLCGHTSLLMGYVASNGLRSPHQSSRKTGSASVNLLWCRV